MADETLVIPPIRQSLEDVNSAQANGIDLPVTDKTWYLFWQRIMDQVNWQRNKVTSGTHADRPSPDDVPNGALYSETDRGGVIYQNVNGVWKYLAGTMWGTITPDQRPTDLGVNDGGFDFRGTDDAREFLWSQSAWVEVTEIRYGTHAGRPNPVDVVNGALYVESDRGGVIYQNQNNVWKYLASTMWGTLSPDQRPTDLGVNDNGFDFRATDQQREFVWSQTVWIEVTPAAQTPWASDIDAAGHRLLNTGFVGVQTGSPQLPLDVYSATSTGDLLLLRGQVAANGDGPGILFQQNNLSVLQARIKAVYESTSNGFAITFSTFNGIALGERMRITAVGNIVIPNLPNSNPGAGTKMLWYDPADGNRVKFSP